MHITGSLYQVTQVRNPNIADFIKGKNKEIKYIVSNCAGAQLVRAGGIANGRKIVISICGGEQLLKNNPNLNVQDDSVVTYIKDGTYLFSNENLTSYISALNLV